VNERPTVFDKLEIGREQPIRLVSPGADFDFNSRGAERFDPASRYLAKRIDPRRHDAADTRGDNGIHARRSFPKVGARLKRHVERRAFRGIRGFPQGIDFRVRVAKSAMPPLPDGASIANDDGPDHGIRLHRTFAPPRQLEGTLHPEVIA
jgi:hypothetical protein